MDYNVEAITCILDVTPNSSVYKACIKNFYFVQSISEARICMWLIPLVRIMVEFLSPTPSFLLSFLPPTQQVWTFPKRIKQPTHNDGW
jgi:hypothetical protein